MINKPRGTSDFLPIDTAKWQYVEKILREVCSDFGYEEIRTPIFEETELFKRGVGDTTDIVQKEMYTFEDAGGRSITLRPENTAAVVRAYVENKIYALTQPTKLYYIGPMFRYERPQAGRFRQFHQFGVEVLGATSASADAEIIALAMEFYRRIGLKDLKVSLNSVGCPKCRPIHRKALQEYLQPRFDELCPTCQGRFEKNPLRIFDCKNPECQEIIADAPKILDCLCDECNEHFDEVKSYLEISNIPYDINVFLVRGLDYYTKTAFEIMVDGIGAQAAICGGGRYDGLVEEIGGNPTPGVGFALGMERIFRSLEAANIEIDTTNSMDVFVAAMGKNAAVHGFAIINELRQAGISAFMDNIERSLKAQMKYADKFNAKYVIIIGDDEIAKGSVCVKNMATSEQCEIALTGIAEELIKILK